MRKRKFFKRILIFQVMITVFYMIVFSVVNYFQSTHLINKSFDKENKIVVDQISRRADSIFKDANETVIGFLENSYLISWVENPDDIYNASKVCEELQRHGKRDSFNVCFKSHEDNLIVSAEGTYTFEYFLKHHKFEEMDSDKIEKRLSDENGSVFLDSEEYLLEVKKYTIEKDEMVYCLKLYNKDELFHRLGEDNTKIILLKNSQIVSKIGDFKNKELSELCENEDESSDYGDYRTYRVSTIYKPFDFIYCMPKNSLDTVSRTTNINAVLIGLIFGVLGLVLVYFSTNGIYSPIDNLLKLMDFTGKKAEENEISYIMNLYSELDMRNLKYEEISRYTEMTEKKRAIENLLQGIISRDKAEETIKKYNITCFDGEFYVVYLKMQCTNTDIEADVGSVLHEQIRCIVSETFNDNGIQCEVLTINLMNIVLLCRGNKEAVSDILLQVCGVAETVYDCQINCIISQKATNVDEAHKRYDEVLFASEMNVFNANKLLSYAGEDNQQEWASNIDFYYPIETERSIISNLVAGKIEEAQRIFDNVMEINMNYIKSANVNIGFLKNILSGTIVRTIQFVNCGNDTELLTVFGELRRANSINELTVQIKNIFAIIHTFVHDNVNVRNKEMIDSVCKIIEKEYDKDISLAEIAYKFNVSQSHLSELFKKYTGDNFKNYVNRKKIDKAKEILENNKNIKVKQLSDMLGFNGVTTFIKVFGKYTGMSPGQYAKAMAVKSEKI